MPSTVAVSDSALMLADAAKFPEGSMQVPYNSGFFQASASQYGIDHSELFKRLVCALRCGNLASIQGLFAKGGTPMRLFGNRGNWLKLQLQATLMQSLPPQEVMRHLNTIMVFDGVHLTLSGFAAASVAAETNTYAANIPSGMPILTEPSSASLNKPDDHVSTGSACSSEVDDSDMTAEAAKQSKLFQYDPIAGVNSPHCPLACLYSRWPHLVRLLQEQGSPLSAAAQCFLDADAAGESADPPLALVQAYYQHLQLTQTCAGMWVHRAEGAYMQNVGLTSRIMELLGFDLPALTDYVKCDSDTLPGRSVHWIHPSCLGRRAAAALDASSRGLHAYSFEGLFLRMVGGVASAPADSSPPCTSQTEVLYSPFYAVQTTHMEHYPNGKKRMEVIYLSDIVHARSSMLRQEGLHIAKTEVQALCSLLLAQASCAPAAAAMRRKAGNTMDFALQLVNALDAESQVRLLKRLGMLSARHKDPLLLQALPSRSQQTADTGTGMCPGSNPASSDAGGGLPPDSHCRAQSMAGLDWASLDSAYSELTKHFGESGFQALAQGTMAASQQPPKEAVCMFGKDELKAAFPFSSITAQNTRWL